MSRSSRIRMALRLYRATRCAALVALVPVLLFGDGANTPVLFALSAVFLLAACLHAAAGAWLQNSRGGITEAMLLYPGCLRIRMSDKRGVCRMSDNRFPYSQSRN